jgi:hypothetical protein
MTIHSLVEYKCKYCGADFVPIPEAPHCPNCGMKSEEIFSEFIDEALCSAVYNISIYKSTFPSVWGILGIGDQYYAITFSFISFLSTQLKIEDKDVLTKEYSESEAQSLVSQFLEDFGDSNYLKTHLKVYLRCFLMSAKVNLTHWGDKAIKPDDKYQDPWDIINAMLHKRFSKAPNELLGRHSESSDHKSGEKGQNRWIR